jgi:hypothetical protein
MKVAFFVQKIVILTRLILCKYGVMSDDILVLDGLTAGQKARFTRLAKGLRQIDVASQANVQPIDITRLERGRYVLPTRRKRILAVLGLLEDTEGGQDKSQA